MTVVRRASAKGVLGDQHRRVLLFGAEDPDQPDRGWISAVVEIRLVAEFDASEHGRSRVAELGGCFENANAPDLGEPFGVQCFDPQAVAHPP